MGKWSLMPQAFSQAHVLYHAKVVLETQRSRALYVTTVSAVPPPHKVAHRVRIHIVRVTLSSAVFPLE